VEDWKKGAAGDGQTAWHVLRRVCVRTNMRRKNKQKRTSDRELGLQLSEIYDTVGL